MRNLLLSASCLLASVTALATPATRAEAQANAPTRENERDETPLLRFVGELLDENNQPISGVFRVTFELHNTERSTTPAWSESDFVAVELGAYTVDLGKTTPIPNALFGKKAWLSVAIQGFGEVLRQELTVERYTPPPIAVPPAIAEIAFAALADRALLADRARGADDADRLGGKTLAEIDRYPELHRLFTELRQQVNIIRTSGGTRVANRTTAVERVGGNGGVEYRSTCPEGQVVVGISGRADEGVNAIGLICAPLEHAR